MNQAQSFNAEPETHSVIHLHLEPTMNSEFVTRAIHPELGKAWMSGYLFNRKSLTPPVGGALTPGTPSTPGGIDAQGVRKTEVAILRLNS